MHQLSNLPIHPTKRHPITGEPLRAIWVRPDGRVCWPIMGGAPEGGDGAGAGAAGAGAGGSGDGAGAGGAGAGAAAGSQGDVPAGYAVDTQGRSLGYPASKPTSDMTDAEQAAYWRHHSQKHEGRFKSLVGDRTFDQAKADLEAFQKAQREQQTPAEQALTDKFNEGKAAAAAELTPAAAKAIFRVALGAQGIEGTELDDLVQYTDAKQFIGENGEVDTDKVIGYAKRFSKSGTDNGRQRDFGAGRRNEQTPKAGAQGKAMLERRGFVKPAS